MYPQVSPHDSRLVLLRSDMTGAYISRDGGNSWRLFHLGGGVSFFAFDPRDSDTIYANAGGLFRSSDAGRSWKLIYPDPEAVTGVSMAADNAATTLLTAGDPALRLTALAVDPADSNRLYAGFADIVATSPDGGKT